ncbi:MAG: alpha/beta hydrolase [Flavobacteriaceae bacterium]
MKKIHLYFMPGLGANPKIFEHISLPKDKFEIHLLEWKIPISEVESIQDYAKRMTYEIKHQNPVLLGVSFGGVLVQEIAKIIDVKKIILVSSIKSHYEFPNRLKLLQKTKAYKFFPTKIIENFDKYKKYFLGDFLKKRADLYTLYLSVNDAVYLKWAIYSLLHWKQDIIPENILHIHGNHDHVFPSKHIHNFTEIKNGSHVMILLKAKEISEIIISDFNKFH